MAQRNESNTKEMETRIEEFRCRRCGRCCTGPGYVNIGKKECRRIADFLGLSLDAFFEKYTVWQSGYDRWLIDAEGQDQPCVFLERDASGLASCRIEGEAKPKQCKEFPFKWRQEGFEKWCAAFSEEQPDK